MNQDGKIRLTEYSHGSGCGCKIAPDILDNILKTNLDGFADHKLLVGNNDKDDAAAYDIGNGEAIISTTDFFMPIVDDPFTFGKIAATNALSDVYAMGGTPLMAVAIFGWPLDKLPTEYGRQVVDGGRSVCHETLTNLAGGHSIDTPEPIFGLAVTGRAKINNLKRNDAAKAGDTLFLTKPLGVGILTTAHKQNKLKPGHLDIAIDNMLKLNKVGIKFAKTPGINTMTDVTGFGLAGHLNEICQASNVQATLEFDKIPLLPHVMNYLSQGCSPRGAARNHASYGKELSYMNIKQQQILCDPQTSGGLLVSVEESVQNDFLAICEKSGLELEAIGTLHSTQNPHTITII